jgi:cation:H+ antiporter
VSPLVVGLTVVAYGTSAPELAVSVRAAAAGSGAVAVGNAVGSNLFNVLVILGVSALLGGLSVHQRLVRVDVPLLLAVTAVVWWLGADGSLGAGEGVALLGGIAAYSVGSYLLGRRESPAVLAEYDAAFGGDRSAAPGGWGRAAGLVAVGLAALVVGAQLLVNGATEMATALGVSELVIGLTVVAAGTSLPELATSVVASRRGERDIAVGNIVGSNLFNLLAVLGASAVAGGGVAVPAASTATDLPVSLLVTLLALPALALGLSLSRAEGLLLLAAYGGYLAYLVLDGTGSAAAPLARQLLMIGLAGVAVALPLWAWAVAGRRRRSHR